MSGVRRYLGDCAYAESRTCDLRVFARANAISAASSEGLIP